MNGLLIVFFVVFMSSALLYALVCAFSGTRFSTADKNVTTLPKDVANQSATDVSSYDAAAAYDPFLRAKKVFGEIGACCG